MCTFGCIAAGNHLRQILARVETLAIYSQLPISKVREVFDANGKLLGKKYGKRFSRFLEEFEWYVSALSKPRKSRMSY